MNRKARITYRFDKDNGAREERQSDAAEHRVQSNVVSFFQEEMKFTSDIGTWNSPFQDDARALEELIRATDGNDTASKPFKSRREAAISTLHPQQRISPAARQDEAKPAFMEAEASLQCEEPAAQNMKPNIDWSNTIPLGDEGRTYVEKRGQGSDVSSPESRNVNAQMEEAELLLAKDVRDQEENSFGRGALVTAVPYRPGRGPSWYKVLASVIGAVATGALFGYLVLALFTGDQTGGPIASVNTVADAQNLLDDVSSAGNLSGGTTGLSPSNNGANDISGGGKDITSGSIAGKTVSVNIPASAYYMLQYGVFSSKEGLDEAVAGLNDKGLAAAQLTSNDDFRVFIGMAGDRSDALMLKQLLADMELYVKQIDLPAVSSFTFAGNASTVETFFRQTRELIDKLESMTVAKLVQSTDGEADWSDLHQKWTQTLVLMESGVVDNDGRTSLHKLQQAINTAVIAAGEYEKNASDAHLWSIQTALMEAIFVQNGWFASMDAL